MAEDGGIFSRLHRLATGGSARNVRKGNVQGDSTGARMDLGEKGEIIREWSCSSNKKTVFLLSSLAPSSSFTSLVLLSSLICSCGIARYLLLLSPLIPFSFPPSTLFYFYFLPLFIPSCLSFLSLLTFPSPFPHLLIFPSPFPLILIFPSPFPPLPPTRTHLPSSAVRERPCP